VIVTALSREEIEHARKLMMLGKGLTEIAHELGVSSLDLDLNLWRRLLRRAAVRAA
jgi:hypothetical protein